MAEPYLRRARPRCGGRSDREWSDGFRALPGGEADILVSQEASTYAPEMRWLNERAGGALPVFEAESYAVPTAVEGTRPRSVYRFFELFDLPNIPTAGAMSDGGGGYDST